jgi:hypothetical protein
MSQGSTFSNAFGADSASQIRGDPMFASLFKYQGGGPSKKVLMISAAIAGAVILVGGGVAYSIWRKNHPKD